MKISIRPAPPQAFAEGECGWWKDVLYKSLIPANVYTPEQYADGWEEEVL